MLIYIYYDIVISNIFIITINILYYNIKLYITYINNYIVLYIVYVKYNIILVI